MKKERKRFLSRLAHLVVSGLLLLALTALDVILGCCEDKSEPKYYYGCPADVCGDDEVDGSVLPTDVAYGPLDYAAYGPLDYVPDPGADRREPTDLYGALDYEEPDVQVDKLEPTDLYGPQDLSTKDCPPMGWYGPPPCASEEDCVKQYGPDYYCNEDNTVPSPCDDDKPMKYPVCEPKK